MLDVQDLVVRYGPVAAVQGLTMHVAEGELVALIGANGAGKSTTMAAIAGVHKPASGRITFEDTPITGLSSEAIARRGLSLVPEDRGIFPSLTVEQNLRLGSYLRRRDPETPARLETVLDRFPVLRDRFRQGAGTLSGGEQQQLAIGRALLSHPRLLMLDEPTLGLSPALVDAMYDLIVELHDEGVTILLVEQNVSRTLEVADRAYLLATGELVASGTPAELLESASIAGAYMGRKADG